MQATCLRSIRIPTGSTLDHYTVTSAGFTYYNYSQYTESTLNGFGCFKLSGGLAFGNAGGVANPATVPATQLGVFPVSGGGTFSTSQSFVPDSSLQSAFYLADTAASGTTYSGAPPDGIEAFNQNTFLPISSVSLKMRSDRGHNLLQWCRRRSLGSGWARDPNERRPHLLPARCIRGSRLVGIQFRCEPRFQFRELRSPMVLGILCLR